MTASTGIRAGRAFVELFADDSRLVRGLKAAQKKIAAFGSAVSGMGKRMMALGGAIAAPLAAAAKATADSGAALWDMSQRTGVAVEALSALAFAADMTGADMETVETAIKRMQRSIANAASGSASAQEALATLGLTVRDLAGLSPDKQFEAIAARLRQIQDPTLRAAAAMELFGRSGTGLLPMVEQLEELTGQARDMGFIRSTASAREADEFDDALTLMSKAAKSLAGALGSAVIPILKEKAQWLMRLALMTRDWVKQNRGLIASAFQIATAVTLAGAGLYGLGKAITAAGTAFKVLSVVAGVAHTVLGAVVSVLGLMLTPIGLVVAAAAALGGYLLYASGAGGKALSWLGEKFNVLKDDALSAYQGIADALAAGDIGLAAKVLWLTLKMEWQRGVNWVSSIWNGALLWLKQRATEVFYGLVMVVETIWHGLEVAWIETTAFLSSVWTNFCAGIHHAWMWVVKSLQETWNKLKSVFDSSFNAEAANAAVEAQYQQARDQMWNQAKQQMGEREAQRAREREQAAATHEATMQELLREGEAAKAAQQAEYDRKMAANQTELDQARQEWQAALEQARQKRTAAEGAQGPDKMKGPEDLAAALRGQVAGLGDALGKHTIGVAGTFNAMEARGLGAGGVADRIANAAEETARNTKKLLDEARNGGLAFE